MYSPPGWYPDPAGAPLLRFWDGWRWTVRTGPYPVDEPPLLDREIAALKAADPLPWGTRPVVVPLAAFVVAIVFGVVVAALINPGSRAGRLGIAAVLDVGLEVFVGFAAYRAGRDIALRAGGWAQAFGLRRPRWKDLLIALGGVGAILIGRLVLGLLTVAFGGVDAVREAQNLKVSHVDAAVIALLVVVAGFAAPIIEELVFRGLILRTLMQRWSFWPAALVSSAIFGIGHTYEVSSVAGAVVLAANVGLIGTVHCVLVRYTGRLAPAMMSHAIVNLAAVAVLATGVTS